MLEQSCRIACLPVCLSVQSVSCWKRLIGSGCQWAVSWFRRGMSVGCEDRRRKGAVLGGKCEASHSITGSQSTRHKLKSPKIVWRVDCVTTWPYDEMAVPFEGSGLLSQRKPNIPNYDATPRLLLLLYRTCWRSVWCDEIFQVQSLGQSFRRDDSALIFGNTLIALFHISCATNFRK